MYTCSKCGEDVIYRELSKETKALSSYEEPVDDLPRDLVYCRQCELEEEIADDEPEENGYYVNEVDLWNYSGLTITPEQRVVLNLNY